MARARNKRFLGIPDEFWIGFVIMVGLFLKLVYCTAISYDSYTLHAGSWTQIVDGKPNPGHLGLIQYYMTYMHLPDFDPRNVQCYANPPFYYIVCGLIMKIIHQMIGWSAGISLHCLLCLNVIYVAVGEGCALGIVSKFGIRGRKYVICVLYLTFFPAFYNLCSTLDGSAMSFMFMMLCLNSVLSWYESRRGKTLLQLGINLGLGLMTSYTVLMVLPAMIVIFRNGCIDGRRSEIPYGKQFKRFGIAVAILGLWWPVYLLIRFHVPLFYVETEGNILIRKSFFSRIKIPGTNLLRNLHFTGDPSLDYNIWAQTFKTALFDFFALDFRNSVTYFLGRFALGLSIAMWILEHVMWIWSGITQRVDRVRRTFLMAGYFTILIGYIVVCFRYPYIENMRFMAITPILIFPLVGMGLCGDGTANDNYFERGTTEIMNWMVLVFSIIIAFLFGFYAV